MFAEVVFDMFGRTKVTAQFTKVNVALLCDSC